MSTTVSIARLDVFTVDGSHDTTLYEVRVDQDGEFLQDLQLETAEELVTLRDTLTAYINRNNLDPSRHE